MLVGSRKADLDLEGGEQLDEHEDSLGQSQELLDGALSTSSNPTKPESVPLEHFRSMESFGWGGDEEKLRALAVQNLTDAGMSRAAMRAFHLKTGTYWSAADRLPQDDWEQRSQARKSIPLAERLGTLAQGDPDWRPERTAATPDDAFERAWSKDRAEAGMAGEAEQPLDVMDPEAGNIEGRDMTTESNTGTRTYLRENETEAQDALNSSDQRQSDRSSWSEDKSEFSEVGIPREKSPRLDPSRFVWTSESENWIERREGTGESDTRDPWKGELRNRACKPQSTLHQSDGRSFGLVSDREVLRGERGHSSILRHAAETPSRDSWSEASRHGDQAENGNDVKPKIVGKRRELGASSWDDQRRDIGQRYEWRNTDPKLTRDSRRTSFSSTEAETNQSLVFSARQSSNSSWRRGRNTEQGNYGHTDSQFKRLHTSAIMRAPEPSSIVSKIIRVRLIDLLGRALIWPSDNEAFRRCACTQVQNSVQSTKRHTRKVWQEVFRGPVWKHEIRCFVCQ